MPSDPSQILRVYREQAGLSQGRLAEAAGTSTQQISKLENGERRLSREWAMRLAPALNTTWWELLGVSSDVATGLVAEDRQKDADEATGRRLFRIRRSLRLSTDEVARRADVSPATIARIENGQATMTASLLGRLCEALGVEPRALLFDEPAPAKDVQTIPLPSGPAAVPSPLISDGVEYKGRFYASLPVYDVAVSAGPGAFNSDHAEPEGWHLLGLEHIRRVTRARFEDLALVRVSGDSMSPTLLNDDQILVDRSVHKVGRDGMYVIATGEEVQVKRIMRDWASKTLTVASDNPAYEPSRGVQEEDLVILGRVVWISRNVGG
ncbi:XRE family transcriptional regulator [Pseudoroseomonas cervicalis]|uniref:XRE family transcriptional regulator n=1 Tax=Teichococcus cervicalis TaxID=204525 RepID=UPI002784D974|nr:XRE family transcriptional regulator [Pseudoroseomonas cervicalis]MDQ1081425.1 transcriptional regulator with XRE-family HTH domain [Pseudoroseomonas cervicalis]